MMVPEDRVDECPHCDVRCQFKLVSVPLKGTSDILRAGTAPDQIVQILVCRNCNGLVLEIARPVPQPGGAGMGDREWNVERAYPSKLRPPSISDDIPIDVRDAYIEAWALQNLSEHAAAVMARRCLQLALRRKGFIRKTLNAEIEAAEKDVSSDLAVQLHYVREVGNIGAHPMDADGSVDFDRLVHVEPGELVALFGAIREAMDELFARPARKRRDLEALNSKLVGAGRKPIGSKP